MEYLFIIIEIMIIKINSKNLVYEIDIHNKNTALYAVNLLNVIYNEEDCFIIHADKNIINYWVMKSFKNNFRCSNYSNIHVVSLSKNKYLTYKYIILTLKVMKYALEFCGDDWSHMIKLSGDSYPLKNISFIRDTFLNHSGYSIINVGQPEYLRDRIWNRKPSSMHYFLKFEEIYGGSGWWGLSRDFCEYINKEKKIIKKFIKYYKKSVLSDESFFQTVLMNSPYKNKIINKYIIYNSWRQNRGSHADIIDDIIVTVNETIYSDLLFARKIHNITIIKKYNKIIGLINTCDFIVKNSSFKKHLVEGHSKPPLEISFKYYILVIYIINIIGLWAYEKVLMNILNKCLKKRLFNKKLTQSKTVDLKKINEIKNYIKDNNLKN